MKNVKLTTTAKDILSLVNYVCSKRTNLDYTLCNESEVQLEYPFPESAPKWIVPVTFHNQNAGDETQIKYFIFDHEFCSLYVQNENPNIFIRSVLRDRNSITWLSVFHHWRIKQDALGNYIVVTVFNIPKTESSIQLTNRNFYESTPRCPVLFLTCQDIMNAFPFKEIISQVKSIELKVTNYNEVVWLLTQQTGKKYVIYPFILHRFYDELEDLIHIEELRDPQVGENFLVHHQMSDIIFPLIAFKMENEQELSVLSFGKMKLK